MEESNFLNPVEEGAERVYLEDSSEMALKLLVPPLLGGIGGLVIVLTYALIFGPMHFVAFLILFSVPLVAGFAITVSSARRINTSDNQYAVRGLRRIHLSQAIQFLDMVAQGHADIGRLEESPGPAEYAASPTLAFGSTIIVLKKLNDDTKTVWLSTLQQSLAPLVSWKVTWFLRVTISGTLIIVPLVMVIELFRIINIMSSSTALPFMVLLITAAIVLMSALGLYAVKSSRSEVPKGVLDAITEPRVKFETERALEQVIGLAKNEGRFPLRVLVLGKYKDLEYTDRRYRTSKGLELTAAILYPYRVNADEAMDE